METAEFVNQTKIMFQETVTGEEMEDSFFIGGARNSVGPSCSLACPAQSCFLSSNSQAMLLDHNVFSQCNSSYVSFNESLVTKSRGLDSWNSFPTQSNDQDLFDSLRDFGIPDDFDISQLIPPSPDQNQQLIPMNNEEKGGISMPVGNECHLDFHSHKPMKHNGDDSNALGPRKGLFSKLGIDLEGISGTSHAVSSVDKRRKTGNAIWEMSSLQNVLHKSEPDMWMANSYGMNCLSKDSQAKKEGKPKKATKRKAKPGTRPRPKDRQQILDRMAELRELVPNGDKVCKSTQNTITPLKIFFKLSLLVS